MTYPETSNGAQEWLREDHTHIRRLSSTLFLLIIIQPFLPLLLTLILLLLLLLGQRTVLGDIPIWEFHFHKHRRRKRSHFQVYMVA